MLAGNKCCPRAIPPGGRLIVSSDFLEARNGPDMRMVFLIAAMATSLTGCTYYRPSLEERIHIVDSPADIRACRRLGEVSGGVLPTSPGFVHHIDAMLTATVALGGTDLFLQRIASDWSYVRGVAYLCPFDRPERIISHVVRAAG
jgi:hypothetical protein